MKKHLLPIILIFFCASPFFAQQGAEVGILHSRSRSILKSHDGEYSTTPYERNWGISYGNSISQRLSLLTRAKYHRIDIGAGPYLAWCGVGLENFPMPNHDESAYSLGFGSADLQVRWRVIRVWRFDLSLQMGLGLMVNLPDKNMDYPHYAGYNRAGYRTNFSLYHLVGSDLRFRICDQLGFDLGIGRRNFFDSDHIAYFPENVWVTSVGFVWAL